MIMCYDAPCYGVTPGSDGNAEVIVSMDRQRRNAASLELKSGKLWISGNYFSNTFLNNAVCLRFECCKSNLESNLFSRWSL